MPRRSRWCCTSISVPSVDRGEPSISGIFRSTVPHECGQGNDDRPRQDVNGERARGFSTPSRSITAFRFGSLTSLGGVCACRDVIYAVVKHRSNASLKGPVKHGCVGLDQVTDPSQLSASWATQIAWEMSRSNYSALRPCSVPSRMRRAPRRRPIHVRQTPPIEPQTRRCCSKRLESIALHVVVSWYHGHAGHDGSRARFC